MIEDDILNEFLIETNENIEKLDSDFLLLEKETGSEATLSNIFRIFHSLKGACGFVGFTKLEAIAHSCESILGAVREGALTINGQITNTLLKATDSVKKILKTIEVNKNEGSGDYSELLKDLGECLSGSDAKPADKNTGTNEPQNNAKADSVQNDEAVSSDTLAEIIKNLPDAQKKLFSDTIGDILIKKGSLMPEDIENTLNLFQPAEIQTQINEPVNEQAETDKTAQQPAVKSSGINEELVEPAEQKSNIIDSNIRVNVELLDKLMNLVGELVLVRNQFMQLMSEAKESSLTQISQRLNLITTELQENIMKTRMQPINNVWRTFPRIVRDMAQNLNKKIDIKMEGKETELDKTLIEAIKDPLTHILRNSIDHGIEAVEKRLAAGKKETGTLLFRAFHEGGQVNIEIADDGNGIDILKVKQKAIQKGIITASQAALMNERELLHLIFMPGFSTAEKVTNISGRGVGMDVVKKNIEKIGGTVEVESIPKAGSTVKIKIPLTLTIIPALIVTAGIDKFAIPQANLIEVLKIKEKDTGKIEQIHGTPVYRLRGKLLPLVNLNEQLLIDNENSKNLSTNIIVLKAGANRFGLIVDSINDTEEIVVKPLSKIIRNIPVFAGATIRGDGKIALIIDVLGIAKVSGVTSSDMTAKIFEENKKYGTSENKQQMLLFTNHTNGRMAIPLSCVSRLELFESENFEKAGENLVIQYREKILPIINISNILEERRKLIRETSEELQVNEIIKTIVFEENGMNFGLAVNSIIDIVEGCFKYQNSAVRKGVSATSIIQNKVTEILDINNILEHISNSQNKSSSV